MRWSGGRVHVGSWPFHNGTSQLDLGSMIFCTKPPVFRDSGYRRNGVGPQGPSAWGLSIDCGRLRGGVLGVA